MPPFPGRAAGARGEAARCAVTIPRARRRRARAGGGAEQHAIRRRADGWVAGSWRQAVSASAARGKAAVGGSQAPWPEGTRRAGEVPVEERGHGARRRRRRRPGFGGWGPPPYPICRWVPAGPHVIGVRFVPRLQSKEISRASPSARIVRQNGRLVTTTRQVCGNTGGKEGAVKGAHSSSLDVPSLEKKGAPLANATRKIQTTTTSSPSRRLLIVFLTGMADQEDDGGKGLEEQKHEGITDPLTIEERAPASIKEQQLKETLDTLDAEERVEEQKLERIADTLDTEESSHIRSPPSIEEQLKETLDTEENAHTRIQQAFAEVNQGWLDTMPYPLYSEESRTIASGKFVEGTLESLIKRNDWLKVDEYLKMIVNYNFFGSTPAIIGAPVGEINKEHPELALLPRRQHIHDLLVKGKYDEASEYYKHNLSILEGCGSETVHAALSDIDSFITNRAAALENDDDIGIAIKDYIYLYFPLLRPKMEWKKRAKKLSLLWEFAWRTDEGFRCFACHQPFRLNITSIGTHLKGGAIGQIRGCPAATEKILERLQIAEQKMKARSGGSGRSTHEHPPPEGEDGGGDDSAGPSNAPQVLD